MGNGGVQPAVLHPALFPKAPRTLGAMERFSLSALSPAVAVIFTNPFDTAKVRLQLQVKSLKGQSAAPPGGMVYKSSFDAIVKIFKNEGIRGLQKGLTPAMLREGSKNFFRIGMYDPIMTLIHDPASGVSAPPWKRMLAGSLCGVMGAFSCNPFELVKTRLQSQVSGTTSTAIGHQHKYTGVLSGLRDIVQRDGAGLRGLYRGAVLSMGRSVIGSGTNLSSYSMIKEWLLVRRGWDDSWVLDMIAGLGSGVVACVFMNPVDVVRTRYYNQPYVNGKGVDFSSGVDAASKIFRNEGASAFYQGLFTHFLRIGPHFCLTFVFLGVFRRQLLGVYGLLDMRDSFKSLDKDGDGVLGSSDISNAIRRVIPPPDVYLTKDAVGDYETMITQYTHRILDKADANHDKTISFEEYSAMTEEVNAICVERQIPPIRQRSLKSFA